MKKLVSGFLRFQREVFPQARERFEALKTGQQPRALLITCSDSRVVSSLITQTEPGELFLCRNAGNIVPPYGDIPGGVSATIEYAVDGLRVPNIIVCGHSHCGAMHGVLHPETVKDMPIVSHWLHYAETARRLVHENYPDANEAEALRLLTFENVLVQIDHLMTHPSVATAVTQGRLGVFGWVYELEHSKVYSFNARTGQFEELVSEENIPEATPIRRRTVIAGQD